MEMDILAMEGCWIGKRCRMLVVILASVLAVEIGNLQHALVGVEAQFPGPPASIPPIPSALNISALPPIISLPPGLPPIPQAFPPIPSLLTPGYLDEKIKEYTASFGRANPDCFTRADDTTTFDSVALLNVSSQCVQNEQDFLLRLCEQQEIDLYLGNLKRVEGFGVPPNINCNSSSWPKACNPGWAGAIDRNYATSSNAIPIRVSNSKSCCAGFFCPAGLTCMIPCPMGAYCPLSFFDPFTYSCIPYYYPALQDGHECGGAHLWLNNEDSKGMFCGGLDKKGAYCPDAITQKDCQKGHFCRVGSTVQTKCSILAGCNKDGMKAEDLKVFGILLVVLLSLSLVVIYTCSDQCMLIRERRKDKARESAAHHARQSVSAAERWRTAIEYTKQKAVTLTHTQSATKSKVRRSVTKAPSPKGAPTELQALAVEQDSTDLRVLLGRKVEDDLEKREYVVNVHNPPPSPDVAGSSQDSWSYDLYPEEGPRSVDLYESVQLSPFYSGMLAKGEGLPLPPVKEIKKGSKAWKALAKTRSQIYKYAYGEIEKERIKHQSKPESLKAVVESDGFRDLLAGPRRLEMEIKFVDLCLSLKGSGKKILSYVTGVLRPRRLTAVMGTSGAGKTTFLNALAGKETGSVITGQVFINGVPGSIQAYKRVIGFVPQDDVVHGSLTVYENLAFSATYRLPVGTPRRDRVLVLERIISRLNLGSIRNSLVGTVENRGISGGQRKRVNVGLELVIEPSLLLLDEPTSGLDSTSSRLVVQALSREAALGVNVCFVVHQPSYGLFRMFDDVMLFAKGGYTVYMGPTGEMDAYFSSLGLEVPDRTNPPDYYMDVLEGEAVPENDPSFDLKSLPILWMCHHGYRIPQEVQLALDGKRVERDDTLRISYDAPRSFIQELWDELRVYVLVRSDILKTAFSSVKNLSGRQTPGFTTQYFLILRRATKQRFRESRLVVQDYIILLLAGICVGILSNWQDVSIWEEGYQYTLICLALLIMIASLRTFTVDKLQFWRESSSGVNKLACFLAKDTVDHFNTILKPVVYLSTFYFYNDPRATFSSNYVITLALTYCCTGIAYVVAILLKPQPAQLICVFLPVVATLVVAQQHTGLLGTIEHMSYAFWALQAYTISNAERYTGVWLIQRCQVLIKYGYSIKNYYICITILMLYGLGARILAFLCLIFYNRKRQK
ncbi:unnamed protein product [Calypogeia fissa]